MNEEPGVWVLESVGCWPELSVAVGSDQVTVADDDPVGAFTVGPNGQPDINGAVVSVEIAVTKMITKVRIILSV